MVRVRQTLGKYRIQKRIAEGGFATVFRALDTIEGIPVALKIPHPQFMNKTALEDFRKEVRLTAKLDHPNILPIKNAGFIGDRFVIVYPLGESTLSDRLRKRIALKTVLDFAGQMLEAVAHAHKHGVMHLDIKPENFIIFEGERLRLADFGIAKMARKTINASGAGTVGFIAPEQAMGKPSLRSDVFSLGLIMYRMFTGHLPEWPFDWPPPRFERLRRNVHPQMIALIRRAMSVDHSARFADAGRMLAAFRKVQPRALGKQAATRSVRGAAGKPRRSVRNWKTVRIQEFLRQYRKLLEVRCTCDQCGEPVAEWMQFCPWCARHRKRHHDETRFPGVCPRCRRGLKLDWRFCPWCYGPAVGPIASRTYTDKRYTARCSNARCDRKELMPFMRYCPWCRSKVKKKWLIPGVKDRCESCHHGVVREYWEFCPHCGKSLHRR